MTDKETKKCCPMCRNGGYIGIPMTGMCNGCSCYFLTQQSENEKCKEWCKNADEYCKSIFSPEEVPEKCKECKSIMEKVITVTISYKIR